MIFHRLHNLFNTDSLRTVKHGRQNIFPRFDLAFAHGNIIKRRVRVDANAAEEKEDRSFQLIDSHQSCLQRFFVLAGTAQQKIMRHI
jgi:hypothetical protein